MGRCESPVSGESPAPLPTALLGPHGFPSSASARLKKQQMSGRLALNPTACHSTACQCSAQLRTEQGCLNEVDALDDRLLHRINRIFHRHCRPTKGLTAGRRIGETPWGVRCRNDRSWQ